MCDVELSKMPDDCETLVSVLSLPVRESNFGRSFVSSSVALPFRLFYHDIFLLRFNVVNDHVSDF